MIELLGEHYGVDDAAADAGTIGYEILTALRRALSPDLPRRRRDKSLGMTDSLAAIGAVFLAFLAAGRRADAVRVAGDRRGVQPAPISRA